VLCPQAFICSADVFQCDFWEQLPRHYVTSVMATCFNYCCCPQAFIRSADVFQCDFWELPAVQQLARDAATAPLLKLLDVMLNGDLPGGREVL
jgi:hypothetical protein